MSAHNAHALPEQNSSQSFHDLLVGLLPFLRQQAFALTRNKADADDLVQSAVTNALRAQASFEPGTNFRAWMMRILRNRFFSDFRKRRDTVDIDDVPSISVRGDQEDSLVMQELRRNIARLAPESRRILVMISVQGLTYEEASEELGVAIGTLKCRVFRARNQLRIWMLGEDEAADERAARKAKAAGRIGTAKSARQEFKLVPGG